MNGVIYLITNPKGSIYVGKTTNFKKRLETYRCLDCKSQKRLYNSFIKYGFNNHTIEVLAEYPYEDLSNQEKLYIEKYNSFSSNNPLGMNLTTGGEGYLLSDESRKKISEAMKGEKNHRFGIKQTKEQLDKRIKKGKDHPFYGKKRSPEACQKIRETLLRKGIVPANLGKPLSAETKEKLRQANLGKKWSKEQTENFINKVSKPIICSNGITYKSSAEASRQLKLDSSSITKACKNKVKSVGNLTFEYAI